MKIERASGLMLLLVVACAPHRAPPARYENRAVAVYVRRAPPAMRTEVVPPSPGRDFAWVNGHWRWDRDAYIWTPGRWLRAPSTGLSWVQGRWEHDGRGWYWTPGEWR
jgi:hypothetical protein